MASSPLLLLLLVSSVQASTASKTNSSLAQPGTSIPLTYHNGTVMQEDIPVSIVWYGVFNPAQKSVISDFLTSLTPAGSQPNTSTPSVSQWWNTIDQLYLTKAGTKTKKANILLASQISDDGCFLGKSLEMSQIRELAAKAGPRKGGIAVVFTAKDVAVEGFCRSRCGSHGSKRKSRSVYIWVGNSAEQCPGQCAWPFHQPMYGPQTPPLVAPNGDVGTDGMVMNLASMMAGAVTNPFGDGFFQGPKDAALEAATACPGVYAKGAYPGYAGDLLVEPTTGASYNAKGVSGRKYLLPALFDPATSTCCTLV